MVLKKPGLKKDLDNLKYIKNKSLSMKNSIFKSILAVAFFVTMQQKSFAGFPIGSGRWLISTNIYTLQS